MSSSSSDLINIPYLTSFEHVTTTLQHLKDTIVLLYFTASWCGPCQRIKPFVQQLTMKYPTLKVFLIDVDNADDASARFAVKSMPTFCLFKGKEPIFRFSGADQDKLAMLVEVAIKAAASGASVQQPIIRNT
tara:strand:- start:1100 stop:1495 length:396 start_codon:yes stop_codon:yes gene_type:complete